MKSHDLPLNNYREGRPLSWSSSSLHLSLSRNTAALKSTVFSNEQVARIRSLCTLPPSPQNVQLSADHRARLDANHRRRLGELVAKPCLNVVKGLMKHQASCAARLSGCRICK